MAISDMIKKMGEKSRERKEKIKALDEDIRLKKLVEDRQKSANERELERFLQEKRESQIKEQLEEMRKQKDMDVKFNHNPVNIPNVVSKPKWEVMKEKNQFSGRNGKFMFSNQEFIHKTNHNLMKNNNKLIKCDNNMFKLKGGKL